MKKSIYRKAAESIDAGVTEINDIRCNSLLFKNRIYSCVTIDAMIGERRSHERYLYEDFMCFCGRLYGVFSSNQEAIIALLLFDEIVKHGDHKD